MIVSNVTCMKIEYIRLKHAKWTVWSFKADVFLFGVKKSCLTNDGILLIPFLG
ncbi:hypothetical protein LDENG_00196020 [Lucifuga dentata]|nr:hypothetical protein LDENG_00196020 [Lucifuga dentata]